MPASRRSRARSLKPIWTVHLEDYVQDLAWSADGQVLAACEVSGPIHLFAGSTGHCLHVLEGHGFGTAQVDLASDGSILASAGQDGTAKLWDVNSGELRHALEAGSTWVESVAWEPRSQEGPPLRVATAAGRKLKLWKAEDGSEIQTFPDQPGTIVDLAWSPDGRILASATNGRVALWQPDQADPIQLYQEPACPILSVAWSPTGDRVVAGCQDGTMHSWTLATGDHFRMGGYPSKVRTMQFDRSGRWLATDGAPGPTIWDTSGDGPAGTRPLCFEGHESLILDLGFDPAHPLGLASLGDEDQRLILWQIDAPRHLQTAIDLDAPGSVLKWHPTNSILAVGSEAGLVAVLTAT